MCFRNAQYSSIFSVFFQFFQRSEKSNKIFRKKTQGPKNSSLYLGLYQMKAMRPGPDRVRKVSRCSKCNQIKKGHICTVSNGKAMNLYVQHAHVQKVAYSKGVYVQNVVPMVAHDFTEVHTPRLIKANAKSQTFCNIYAFRWMHIPRAYSGRISCRSCRWLHTILQRCITSSLTKANTHLFPCLCLCCLSLILCNVLTGSQGESEGERRR